MNAEDLTDDHCPLYKIFQNQVLVYAGSKMHGKILFMELGVCEVGIYRVPLSGPHGRDWRLLAWRTLSQMKPVRVIMRKTIKPVEY